MLGHPNFRPHVAEFIRGTGVVVDGVTVQDVGGNGPFTFVLPDDVVRLTLDGCGAGGGGGGGTATGTSRGGGGGGAPGLQAFGVTLACVPGASLTVTVGAGGAGSAATDTLFATATSGGLTSIAGLLNCGYGFAPGASDTTTFRLPGGSGGESNSGVLGQSGNSPNQWYPATVGGGNGGGAPAASPVAGSVGNGLGEYPLNTGVLYFGQGAGGGAASTVGATAGASGGDHSDGAVAGSGGIVAAGTLYGSRQAAGNSTGTVSRGGGGAGGPSIFALYPSGGAGGSAAPAVTGYGAGGGGGGGSAAGATGAPGYVRLTYWSQR